ncbi:hypothetical protein TNCV_1274521 [Trichonephila clavipes]|nr:hypothetical protein TNCV_1274521 [Trichonephila clavipes]
MYPKQLSLTGSFQYVPSHCRVLGDEKADLLAKNALWNTLVFSPIQLNMSRAVFTANFRSSTGHDFQYKHLRRIGEVADDVCSICLGETIEFLHLTTCTALAFMTFNPDKFTKVKFHWAARSLIADFPTDWLRASR